VSEDAVGRLDVGTPSGNATFREKVSGEKLTGATRRPSSVNCAVHELKGSQQGRDARGARPCHHARDNAGAGVIARQFAKTSRHLDCLAPAPSSFLGYHDISWTIANDFPRRLIYRGRSTLRHAKGLVYAREIHF